MPFEAFLSISQEKFNVFEERNELMAEESNIHSMLKKIQQSQHKNIVE